MNGTPAGAMRIESEYASGGRGLAHLPQHGMYTAASTMLTMRRRPEAITMVKPSHPASGSSGSCTRWSVGSSWLGRSEARASDRAEGEAVGMKPLPKQLLFVVK